MLSKKLCRIRDNPLFFLFLHILIIIKRRLDLW
nr:MAG TPA: hypothetical protein [Caudoviricetes sp.]